MLLAALLLARLLLISMHSCTLHFHMLDTDERHIMSLMTAANMHQSKTSASEELILLQLNAVEVILELDCTAVYIRLPHESHRRWAMHIFPLLPAMSPSFGARHLKCETNGIVNQLHMQMLKYQRSRRQSGLRKAADQLLQGAASSIWHEVAKGARSRDCNVQGDFTHHWDDVWVAQALQNARLVPQIPQLIHELLA